MSKKYTREELNALCDEYNKDTKTFYAQGIVNYRGTIKGTRELYSEYIADYALKHIDDFKSIQTVERGDKSYNQNHEGTFDPNSPRTEELDAIKMSIQSRKGITLGDVGRIIDYQVPLKGKRDDNAGKIDLLSETDDTVYILELKKQSSDETLLRCILEGYTYLKTVDKKKLFKDYSIDKRKKLKTAPLIYWDGVPGDDYKALLAGVRPKLAKLMKKLDICPFVLSVSSGEYTAESGKRHKICNVEEEFFSALFNSIKCKDHLKYIDSTKAYYDNRYLDVIREEFKNIDSKELGGADNPDKKVKICSLASSGRLCFLDFRDHKDGIEKAIKTGVGNSTAKMDVVVGDTYYECKCQEIVKGEGKRIKESYLDSPLFREFQIDLNSQDHVKNGELEFSLRELGIESYKMYYELHFNLKQLICHLMAIANENKGKKATLQYVFYTPSQEEIEKSRLLTELYDTLKKEINVIWHCKKIRDFCDQKNHNIVLAKPQFKDISTIEDTIYNQAYNT